MPANLRGRIFLMYTLIFTLILAAAVAALGFYIARAVNEQTITGLDEFAENVGAQVEEQFKVMDRVSTRILFSQNVLDIMGKIQTGYAGEQNYFSQNPEKLSAMYRDFLVILGLDVSNTVINIYHEKAFVTTAQSSVDWSIIRADAEGGILAAVKAGLTDNPRSPVILGPHRSYWAGGSGGQERKRSTSLPGGANPYLTTPCGAQRNRAWAGWGCSIPLPGCAFCITTTSIFR